MGTRDEGNSNVETVTNESSEANEFVNGNNVGVVMMTKCAKLES